MASADAPIAAWFASARRDGAKSYAMAKRSSRPKTDEAVGAKAWVFVAPNQLHRGLGALREADPATTGVLLVAVMLVIGKLRPRATDWVQEASGDVDLTPWKGAVPTGIVLVVLVVIMYASFAGG